MIFVHLLNILKLKKILFKRFFFSQHRRPWFSMVTEKKVPLKYNIISRYNDI